MDNFIINRGMTDIYFYKVENISIFEFKNTFSCVKRLYSISSLKLNTKRGYHAHKNLKQLAWCPYGIVEITLDDGVSSNKFRLDSPEKAVYIGPGIWHEMKWLKSNSVLSVAASEHYDEDDYVRDYEKFLQMVNEGYWNEK